MIPPHALGLVLHTAMAVCALMAVVNSLRYKKRGASAYALAGAFVALGFTLWLYSVNAAIIWIGAGLVLTVLLLVTELSLRSARQGPGR